MTDVRETGLNVFRELMPGLLPDGDVDFGSSRLAGELFEISIDNVFGRLSGREGSADATAASSRWAC
jgi:4-carboxymuconolactone decarboxylase